MCILAGEIDMVFFFFSLKYFVYYYFLSIFSLYIGSDIVLALPFPFLINQGGSISFALSEGK